jgi:hypothetical protein
VSTPAARLIRTFLAVSLVAFLLAVALVWPRHGLEPARSTALELDEPSSAHATN